MLILTVTAGNFYPRMFFNLLVRNSFRQILSSFENPKIN